VKLLVSSRASLNIQGEHRFELGPLNVPPDGVVPALDEVSRYPALLLFSERARAMNPIFEITPRNLAAVVGVCKRLNGLPLAIELASARSNVLTPQALLQRLESQLQVLTGGPRDFPERHRTMRNAIAWSYDLLTDRERRLFRLLSYFVGGFSLEAAEAIARAKEGDDACVLDDLTSLVEKSLVLVRTGEAEETRFVMLETIREFGLERLAERGELAAIADHHCGFYVDLVERGYREQVGDKQSLWFRRLEQEQGNLRLAARTILESADANRAVRFGLNLWRFWDRSQIQEGRDWLDAFLSMPGLAPPDPRRRPLLFAAGRLAYRQADYASAMLVLQECLAIAQAVQDSDFGSAALTHLGHVAYAQGHLEAAERYYTESLTIRRADGDARTISITLHGLARIRRAQGDYAGARALLTERLGLSRKTEDVLQISVALAGLGLVALLERDHTEAERLYRESLTRALEVEDQTAASTALLGLALAAVGRNEPERARPLLDDSLRIASELGARHLIAQCFEGFAAMLAVAGHARRSWRLAACLAEYRQREALPGDAGERRLLMSFLDRAGQSLDAGERAALWATGRTMTLSDAMTEAGLSTASNRQSVSPYPAGIVAMDR
jgi:VCBS repeat-containing protein